MQLHANAALSLNGRRELVGLVVERSWSIGEAAEWMRVREKTCRKWVCRYLAEGPDGLRDRSSAPRHVANKTPQDRIDAICALRKLRFTAEQLAEIFTMPLSTVSGLLADLGMGKLGRLGLQPAVRYERQRPGELIHIDVKKLGRIVGGAGKRITAGHKRNPYLRRTDKSGKRRNRIGWDFVHVAIDDATRLAYAESSAMRRAPPRSGSCGARSRSSSATASPSRPL